MVLKRGRAWPKRPATDLKRWRWIQVSQGPPRDPICHDFLHQHTFWATLWQLRRHRHMRPLPSSAVPYHHTPISQSTRLKNVSLASNVVHASQRGLRSGVIKPSDSEIFRNLKPTTLSCTRLPGPDWTNSPTVIAQKTALALVDYGQPSVVRTTESVGHSPETTGSRRQCYSMLPYTAGQRRPRITPDLLWPTPAHRRWVIGPGLIEPM